MAHRARHGADRRARVAFGAAGAYLTTQDQLRDQHRRVAASARPGTHSAASGRGPGNGGQSRQRPGRPASAHVRVPAARLRPARDDRAVHRPPTATCTKCLDGAPTLPRPSTVDDRAQRQPRDPHRDDQGRRATACSRVAQPDGGGRCRLGRSLAETDDVLVVAAAAAPRAEPRRDRGRRGARLGARPPHRPPDRTAARHRRAHRADPGPRAPIPERRRRGRQPGHELHDDGRRARRVEAPAAAARHRREPRAAHAAHEPADQRRAARPRPTRSTRSSSNARCTRHPARGATSSPTSSRSSSSSPPIAPTTRRRSRSPSLPLAERRRRRGAAPHRPRHHRRDTTVAPRRRARARPHMAERALANLVDNAMKYSPAAIEIVVDGDRVEVRDHGPGIRRPTSRTCSTASTGRPRRAPSPARASASRSWRRSSSATAGRCGRRTATEAARRSASSSRPRDPRRRARALVLTERSSGGRMGAWTSDIFMAPFHPVGQNPTLALERDLDLIQLLDRLGFDEAWVGEHHSAGYEIIASPEVFIGIAAERTKHIKLGTGVSSLPYHHPLMLADRMVLLDHLTRGRTMLGVGPGQLTSDAHMLGIPADSQRPRMEESLDAIMALLRGETVTMETDWFTCATRACSSRRTATRASTSRSRRRSPPPARAPRASTASACCRSRRPRSRAWTSLGHHWNLWEEIALENGHVADRSKWRLVGPMHLAETREQAREGRRVRHRAVLEVLHARPPGRSGRRATPPRRSSRTTRPPGFAVIGTPDDAIAKIDELVESSNGGFGAFLLFGHDWATPAATKPVVRAVRAVRHAEVHRASSTRPRRRATGSPAAAASSSARPRTRSPRRSRTTRTSAPPTRRDVVTRRLTRR